MAKLLYTWFGKLTFHEFGLELVLPQFLENKPQRMLMLIFSGAEHKYIIQVHQHKAINILSRDTVHQPLKG